MVKYLLDTCAISEVEKRPRNEHVVQFLLSLPDTDMFISAITIGEMQRGITRMPLGKRRVRLESFLDQLVIRFPSMVLPIDLQVGRVWGDVYASCQMKGFNLSSSDSLIAATAIHHGLHVVTRNVKDFEPTGVQIVNPWDVPIGDAS
jgi:predicted nucleic acid-binding protein